MLRAGWLGPPLCHLSVSKEYTKGCVIISLCHSLGLSGHASYFYTKGCERGCCCFASGPSQALDWNRLWNLPADPAPPPSTVSSDTEPSGVGDNGTAGKSIPATAQLEWDRLPNCSRARMDLIDFVLYSRKRPNLPHGLIPTPERESPPAADFTVKQRQRQAPRSKEATSPFCLINLVYTQWHFN